MANALITTLGSSGDLNVDVTKYRTFSAEINMSTSSSFTTIFSGVSWTWAKVIGLNATGGSATFPGAPPIILPSNTDFSFFMYTYPYLSSTQTGNEFAFSVSATSTSLTLKPKIIYSGTKVNLLIMVPES